MDLDLFLNEHHVAYTEGKSRGEKVTIRYTDQALEQYALETPLLSCSLPTPGPSTPGNARAFLEGLLAEGQALDAMAARTRNVELTNGAPSTPNDAIGLLAEYGRECAGAIIATPRGDQPTQSGSYSRLTEADIGALITGLPRAPLGIRPEDGIRMSLAGAQPKLLLARFDDAWHEPRDGAASTHILKPTQRWALSADNEAMVMALSRAIGLSTQDTWVEDIAGVRTFVSMRFDREVAPGTRFVRRHHQEDMCQALGIRPIDKYTVGRPSKNLARVVRSFTANPRQQTAELFRQIAFRVIVGDEDGHGKNYGLMLSDGRVSLAPLYDSLCTLMYGELDGTMATPIGNQHNLARVDAAALLTEANAMGIPTSEASEILDSLCSSLESALEGLNPELADEEAMTLVSTTVNTRLARLRARQPLGMDSARSGYLTLDNATWRPPR